jgi:hypothetical protein
MPHDENAPTEAIRTASADGWDVVDLGQRGAAADASEDVVPLLEEAVGERTLFVLPRGRYLVDSEFAPEGWERIGVVGAPRAEIVVTDDAQTFPACFNFKRDEASAVRVENLTFDFTKDGVGPQAVGARVRDQLLIRDIAVRGRCDFIDRTRRPSCVVYPSLVTEDGVGLVENLRLPDGSAFERSGYEEHIASSEHLPNAWGLIGVNVYIHHVGTLRFRDCRVGNFPDAGLYLKQRTEDGRSIVEGGRFWDNGAADVRLGHGDVVRDATIRKTEEKGFAGPGLWLQTGSPVVRDTEIVCREWGGETVRVTSPGGTLDNVTIESAITHRTVRMSGGGSDGGGRDRQGVTVRNCNFETHGRPEGYAYVVRRPDVTHRDCRFAFVGDPGAPGKKHLVYTDAATNWIDCRFDTPDVGIRVDGAGADVRGCQFGDSGLYVHENGGSDFLCAHNRLREANLTVNSGDRDAIADGNLLD